jgi:hypothetical protein
MAVVSTDISMYDPRDTLKAVAAEAIGLNESCYISSDGLAYLVDNTKNDVCHGWAVKAVAVGEEVTLATACRIKPATAQTPGARVYTGNIAGGSCPSTTLAATGIVVGHAMSTTIIYCRAPVPAANG